MAARKSRRVRIGHLEISLLPGETAKRVDEIAREVRDRWQPENVMEEFDCDTIIHGLFKVERYERFEEHFVRGGIARQDIVSAKVTYLAAIRASERTLEMAREGLRRKPPMRAMEEEFAALPVVGMVQ
jgi:16S rRNA C967 or C1407 C5-methylase (RsmB/RsmF family)